VRTQIVHQELLCLVLEGALPGTTFPDAATLLSKATSLPELGHFLHGSLLPFRLVPPAGPSSPGRGGAGALPAGGYVLEMGGKALARLTSVMAHLQLWERRVATRLATLHHLAARHGLPQEQGVLATVSTTAEARTGEPSLPPHRLLRRPARRQSELRPWIEQCGVFDLACPMAEDAPALEARLEHAARQHRRSARIAEFRATLRAAYAYQCLFEDAYARHTFLQGPYLRILLACSPAYRAFLEAAVPPVDPGRDGVPMAVAAHRAKAEVLHLVRALRLGHGLSEEVCLLTADYFLPAITELGEGEVADGAPPLTAA
jgi:hypothetical protein